MFWLEVPGGGAQVLEELSPHNEEGKLLTFESVLIVSQSVLWTKAQVKKPLMEDCPDELDDLEVLENLVMTCFLKEATLLWSK